MQAFDQITILFERFKAVTGDTLSASHLTLAAMMIGREPVPEGPLTVKQAAQVLNCSARTVYDLIDAKRLACHRIGTGKGSIRVMRADVEACRKTDSPALRYLKAI